eukprot:2863628-Alexandrium_andersonii.AAC.1
MRRAIGPGIQAAARALETSWRKDSRTLQHACHLLSGQAGIAWVRNTGEQKPSTANLGRLRAV